MKKISRLSFLRRNNKKTMPNLVSGFTLVEALIAISILMVAITGPMTLTQKGLSVATLSKDQMIASFLAQDAIEAVRNIRDKIAISTSSNDPDAWLKGSGSSPSLSNCICTGDACNFDSTNPTYCVIDTTLSTWDSTSVKNGTSDIARLKITYTSPDINATKYFLKYDTEGKFCDNISYPCDSKFSRYINIKKTSETGVGGDEAVVNVRVSWDSASGLQKMDISDFIYNYSENL